MRTELISAPLALRISVTAVFNQSFLCPRAGRRDQWQRRQWSRVHEEPSGRSRLVAHQRISRKCTQCQPGAGLAVKSVPNFPGNTIHPAWTGYYTWCTWSMLPALDTTCLCCQLMWTAAVIKTRHPTETVKFKWCGFEWINFRSRANSCLMTETRGQKRRVNELAKYIYN